jgi:hypothetical protein
MDSGRIDLWLKEPLTTNDKNKLQSYTNKIGLPTDIEIDFRNLYIDNNNIKKQVKQAIGFVPNFEILLYGKADMIFYLAKEFLKLYGGFLNVSVDLTEDDINNIPGQCYLIIEKKFEWYLMDWIYVSNYFNTEYKFTSTHKIE